MENSYLIQRLKAPQNFDNPFNFGGGYKDGGLSKNAMDLIRPIFSFDYMGAAEFELGALPETLQKMAQNTESLIAGSLTATTKNGNGAEIFYICQEDHRLEVIKRIKLKALAEYGDKTLFTKEHVGLQGAIDKEKYNRNIGWLELDNGFFFFIDKTAWMQTCALFQVET